MLLLFSPDAPYEPSAAIVLLGWYEGGGVSLPEAFVWTLLGVVLFRAARERSYGRAMCLQAEENRKKALRLYEEGLRRNDLSVVDEMVSEDFRDLRRGTRSKLGMERLIADLWASYPDLEVSVQGQEVEGDLVRTHLLLSGTDRGSGVMWYPPTGRRALQGRVRRSLQRRRASRARGRGGYRGVAAPARAFRRGSAER